jgi:hypothetical protein
VRFAHADIRGHSRFTQKRRPTRVSALKGIAALEPDYEWIFAGCWMLFDFRDHSRKESDAEANTQRVAKLLRECEQRTAMRGGTR